jgi:hypothetical protein
MDARPSRDSNGFGSVAWVARHRVLLSGLAVLFAGFLVEGLAILKLSSGHFTYTLDDPYIHLALASRIHDGHYGINAGEPSAPSSSVLWPFLLAPFARARFFPLLPLLIGFLSAAGTVVLFQKILDRTLAETPGGGRSAVAAFALALLVLGTSVIALPFTGMEHSLQVLLAVAILWGMIRELETGRVPGWLPAVIVAAPLVRYENLAVSIAGLLYIFSRGHRRAAIATSIATLVPLAAFSAFLLRLGVGPLPTSVVMKSLLLDAGGRLGGPIGNFHATLGDDRGIVIAIGMVWLLSVALLSSKSRGEKALAGSIGLAVALHTLAGRYGAYNRWEIYVFTLVVLSILYLGRRGVARWAAGQPAPVVGAVAVLWWCVLCGRYLVGLGTVPLAANNIYEQQYQMHRFVVDYYRRPVAANDIGLVSYGNDEYVLDLMGQGTPATRTLRKEPDHPEWMEEAARASGASLAMIYDEWFQKVPASWRRLGELRLGRRRITPAWDRVSFYALGDSEYARDAELLAAFRKSLPAGVEFALAPGPPGP